MPPKIHQRDPFADIDLHPLPKTPPPPFTLAHHHRVLDVGPYHWLGTRYTEAFCGGFFDLLRDPHGRPVCRLHADLKPGEVSLVLR